MENEKRVNVAVDHGEHVFFSDNVTISHNQSKFVIDFSQTTPRFDNVGGNMQQSLVIKHNTIMVEPQFAKIILDLLKKNMSKYEKSFGKVKVPRNKPDKKDLLEKVDKISEKSTRYIG